MDNSLFNAILPYVIGAIGGIIGLFASGFLKEYFDERARLATHKRNVARHVIRICIEASTGNYRISPRNIEDVYGLLTDLEGLDQKMEATMNQFFKLWQEMIILRDKYNYGKDDEKTYVEMGKEIEKRRKKMIVWANSIRVGKDDGETNTK